MKTQMTQILVAALVFGGGAATTAFADGEPELVRSAFHTGYIPAGFDTNDHVQIVGEGTFMNTCYRPATPKVEIDHQAKLVRVNPKAYFYDGMCLQMLVPYHQVLDLGILHAGNYTIVQEGFESLGAVDVKVATNSTPDDYMYAPVSQAYMNHDAGKSTLTLSGEFTNSCMRLVDVIIGKQPKVITVQPIAEMDEQDDCREGKFPFERKVVLGKVPAGRYLLHVRSLNATSVNSLIDLY